MWWNELEVFQQVCFIIGSVTALFMIIQIVMMLLGMDNDNAFEQGDFDGDGDIFNDEGMMSGLKLISMRSVIAFLCFGSWLTFTLIYVLPIWASILIGLVGGAAMGVGVAYAIHAFSKLQSDGNIVIENCIGKMCEVYLTIPANLSGHGKVNVYVQEKLTEFEAVTESASPIKTGAQGKVVAVVSAGVLKIEPYETVKDA